MASITVNAVYQKGKLKLLEKIDVPEDQKVKVEIWVEDEKSKATRRDYENEFEKQHRAFLKLKAELIKKYFGQYVAISNGKVVDVDSDRSKLSSRIHKTYDNTPVYIGQVTEPLETYDVPIQLI